MEAQPDLVRIKGRASNLYLCRDDRGLALIDAGSPGDHQRVLARVQQLGWQPEQINRILITHADIDHAGSLAVLQELTGAAVYAGPAAAVHLQDGTSPQHLPALIQPLANTFFKIKPITAASITLFADNDELPLYDGLRALATPGHTDGHFSFFAPGRGYLFAGDALSTRGGRLDLNPRLITADQQAAVQSAMRLLQLAPTLFACGHGDPISDHSMDDVMQLFNQLRTTDSAG